MLARVHTKTQRPAAAAPCLSCWGTILRRRLSCSGTILRGAKLAKPLGAGAAGPSPACRPRSAEFAVCTYIRASRQARRPCMRRRERAHASVHIYGGVRRRTRTHEGALASWHSSCHHRRANQIRTETEVGEREEGSAAPYLWRGPMGWMAHSHTHAR